MSSIGIVGAGHTGCALAFYAAEQGYDVVLRTMDGHPGNTPKIIDDGGYLDARGIFNGRVSLRIGRGLADLTESILLVALPSHAIDGFLEELSMYNLSNTVLIFIAGNSSAVKANMTINAKAILESATAPYSSRVSPDGSVSFRGIKSRLKLSVLNPGITEKDMERVSTLFPMPVDWCYSVLETFLTGLNGVVHVPTALMNMGWMETTNGDFYFYRQGMSSGVCTVIDALDKERLAVAAAYKIRINPVVDTYNGHYGTNEATLQDFAKKTVIHNSTKGAQKRFLDQDVPHWLVLCSELGLRAGVPTPAIDSLILLASILTGKDYRASGSTLKSLGLEDASVGEVITAFQGGNMSGFLAQSKLQRVAAL